MNRRFSLPRIDQILRRGMEIELLDTEERWSPYLSVEDAYKLDDVHAALREGDTATASKYGKVYRLSRVQ